MVAPISTLSNMEMQLYGGRNFGTSAPSYMNGYQASSAMMNPYAMTNQYSTPMFNGYSNYPNNYNILGHCERSSCQPCFRSFLPV